MHFLVHFKRWREQAIGKPRAAVVVEVEKQRSPCTLRVQENSLCILKSDTLMATLPEGVVVLSSDGKPVKPTGRFYVSTESFDPYHLVTDVFD